MQLLPRIFPSRIGFRQQLALAFTIGIVCLALISSLAISTLSGRTMRTTELEEGRRITETFADQSTLALLYHSPENAEDAAQAILDFPDILGVAIYHLDHSILLSKGETALATETKAQWPSTLLLERETSDAWYFVAPVYAGADDVEESPFVSEPRKPELIGFVRVVKGKKTLNTMARDILRGNLGVSIILAAMLLLVLLIITARLTKPLKNLSEIMQRADQGEEKLRAELSGPKDIIEMQAAFNTMMEVLETRAQELKTTRDIALETARLKSEFAANVSHELRTPLNGVLGMLELLQEMGLTPKQLEYLEVARNSGDSLLVLIDDILDFSQIDAGKLKPNPVDFNLREIMDDVIGLLAGQAQRKALGLGYVIERDVPPVLRGEPLRLRQILINLMGNAVKFTEHGEVAVTVRRAKKEGDEHLIRFEVKDSGIGIPLEARERIFHAFSQVDGSTTRKYGGTGLGLAICHKLVSFLGGEIGVESEPGKGSVFWFKLPLEEVEQTSETAEIDRSDVAGLRVLIVDSSPVNRSFLEHTFNSWMMYCSSATNAGQALQMLQTTAKQGRPYDLAIIDLMMPDTKGNDLVQQIAITPAVADVKLLLMTNQQVSDRGESLLPGIAGYVVKPIKESILYDAITTIIKQDRPEASAAAPAPETGRVSPHLGCHILVAEDNRANQQVAIGMLHRLGCTNAVAATGIEALEAVERERYDLILMDCHMPQVDGYEATRQIRALEADTQHTPIIAMTANVLEGDKDKCIIAGMDDYLPKPLKFEVLLHKLQQWLSSDQGEKVASNPALASNTPPSSQLEISDPLDHKVFSELRDNIGDAFARMIEAFLQDTPEYLESLKEAVANKDTAKLTDLAHSIKGSSKNFGAVRLAAVSKELEEMGRSGSLDDAAEQLARLENEYEWVKVVLSHEIKPDLGQAVSAEEQRSRILIVDDDRGIRIALRNVLEADGYQIEEATNGRLALSIGERHMPDLVLMDAIMPEMDGFTACTELRQLPNGKRLPVLIITALDDEQSIERAFAVGATDYIPKPVHFGVLRQRVARLLHASQAEDQVHKLAYHDPLTGLPNRTLFAERLGELLNRPLRKEHRLAVLFMDLNRFKLVNDTLGHDVGDLLLKAVAGRIQSVVRSKDLVARLGGDEFTVILDDARSYDVAAGIAEKICYAISRPFVFMGQEVFVSTSIGISVYPKDGTDIGTLIKHADTAMFRAKDQGDQYRFYEEGMEAAIAQRLQLENDLRRALERGELVIHYQPQAEVMSGKIVGVEALIRWQHPQRGLVPPAEFIPLAEETGLIAGLGDWMLVQACKQMQSWVKDGMPALRIAVNLSGRQLEDPSLLEKVAKVLGETELPAELLELEITESTLMERAEEVTFILQRLKAMGIQLAIDDFGTGYSSLSYLKQFPIDTLKVDSSFVHDSINTSNGGTFIATIIALAQSLNLKVAAEGVESREQEAFLKAQHCDLMQGYYLSKPLTSAAFAQWMSEQDRHEATETLSLVKQQ